MSPIKGIEEEDVDDDEQEEDEDKDEDEDADADDDDDNDGGCGGGGRDDDEDGAAKEEDDCDKDSGVSTSSEISSRTQITCPSLLSATTRPGNTPFLMRGNSVSGHNSSFSCFARGSNPGCR